MFEMRISILLSATKATSSELRIVTLFYALWKRRFELLAQPFLSDNWQLIGPCRTKIDCVRKRIMIISFKRKVMVKVM